MQIPFYTEHTAIEYSNQNPELFPLPPNRCPYKDCHMPVKLEKHGYYSRYFIGKKFSGVIYIRRYICPVCGRTVSLIPIYCFKSFQYSGMDIIDMLNELYQRGIPLTRFIDELRIYFPAIERRNLNFYRK